MSVVLLSKDIEEEKTPKQTPQRTRKRRLIRTSHDCRKKKNHSSNFSLEKIINAKK